jgi:hypothetical protein
VITLEFDPRFCTDPEVLAAFERVKEVARRSAKDEAHDSGEDDVCPDCAKARN